MYCGISFCFYNEFSKPLKQKRHNLNQILNGIFVCFLGRRASQADQIFSSESKSSNFIGLMQQELKSL